MIPPYFQLEVSYLARSENETALQVESPNVRPGINCHCAERRWVLVIDALRAKGDNLFHLFYTFQVPS
jgi:hypothetical protein